ncbi:hypothetical protein [Lacticaseibacillus sp. GG6-2]
MATRAEQHEFATKWRHLFETGQINDSSGYGNVLGADCARAGFVSDAFAAVTKHGRLPGVADHDATAAFLTAITEIQPLGNAIYSMWEQVTQWQLDGHLGKADNRFWFATALIQLERLTRPLGKIVSITIDSRDTGFIRPDPGALVGQNLTIHRDGWATLINDFASGHRQQQTVPVPTGELDALFATLGAISQDPPCTDCGTWRLTLEGVGGRQQIEGSLGGHEALSERIRALLPFGYLLVFDGAPDSLQRLVVDYQQDASCHEKLMIDRHSNTLAFTQRNGQTRSRLAVATPQVTKLLDELDQLAGSADDAPHTHHELTISARYRYADCKVRSGSLSLDEPIDGWAEQAACIQDWLRAYAPSMIDARLIQRTTPKPGQLLYAQVVFHHGAPAYSYLAAPEFAIGDRVVVPTTSGSNYGTIVAMAYYDPQDAPYPRTKAKKILRLADPLVESEYD